MNSCLLMGCLFALSYWYYYLIGKHQYPHTRIGEELSSAVSKSLEDVHTYMYVLESTELQPKKVKLYMHMYIL